MGKKSKKGRSRAGRAIRPAAGKGQSNRNLSRSRSRSFSKNNAVPETTPEMASPPMSPSSVVFGQEEINSNTKKPMPPTPLTSPPGIGTQEKEQSVDTDSAKHPEVTPVAGEAPERVANTIEKKPVVESEPETLVEKDDFKYIEPEQASKEETQAFKTLTAEAPEEHKESAKDGAPKSGPKEYGEETAKLEEKTTESVIEEGGGTLESPVEPYKETVVDVDLNATEDMEPIIGEKFVPEPGFQESFSKAEEGTMCENQSRDLPQGEDKQPAMEASKEDVVTGPSETPPKDAAAMIEKTQQVVEGRSAAIVSEKGLHLDEPSAQEARERQNKCDCTGCIIL